MKSFCRQGSLVAGRSAPQVLQRALKEFFVGQHRQRCCSCCFQIPRQAFRIKIGADQSAGRRSLFQFGDDGRPSLALAGERPPKAARDMLLSLSLQTAQVRRTLGVSDPAARGGDDLVKAGSHTESRLYGNERE